MPRASSATAFRHGTGLHFYRPSSRRWGHGGAGELPTAVLGEEARGDGRAVPSLPGGAGRPARTGDAARVRAPALRRLPPPLAAGAQRQRGEEEERRKGKRERGKEKRRNICYGLLGKRGERRGGARRPTPSARSAGRCPTTCRACRRCCSARRWPSCGGTTTRRSSAAPRPRPPRRGKQSTATPGSCQIGTPCLKYQTWQALELDAGNGDATYLLAQLLVPGDPAQARGKGK